MYCIVYTIHKYLSILYTLCSVHIHIQRTSYCMICISTYFSSLIWVGGGRPSIVPVCIYTTVDHDIFKHLTSQGGFSPFRRFYSTVLHCSPRSPSGVTGMEGLNFFFTRPIPNILPPHPYSYLWCL